MKYLLTLLVLGTVAGGTLYTKQMVWWMEASDPVSHLSQAPTIEKVRELSELVTMEVPISDVHISELDGFTGGVKMAVAVRGEVQITTNLQQAEYEDPDVDARRITLILPKPSVNRPRVDHEQTRIMEIHRSGLWKLYPGQAGERELTNRAYTAAQRVLKQAADDPKLLARACGRTEKVLRHFFDAVGWQVVIQWKGGAPTASATS